MGNLESDKTHSMTKSPWSPKTNLNRMISTLLFTYNPDD